MKKWHWPRIRRDAYPGEHLAHYWRDEARVARAEEDELRRQLASVQADRDEILRKYRSLQNRYDEAVRGKRTRVNTLRKRLRESKRVIESQGRAYESLKQEQ